MKTAQNVDKLPVKEAFKIRKQEALDAIDQLRKQVEAYDVDTCTWACVGDITHVYADVKNLINPC
jgi:hypothetical protein